LSDRFSIVFRVIQLEILSGSKQGSRALANRLPFTVGRDRQASLPLDDEGVWDRHFSIDVSSAEGCLVSRLGESLTLVNGTRLEKPHRLKNGDLIEAGSVKLRFGLSPTRQSGLRVREWLVWIGVSLLCLGQIALIYFVLP